MYTIENFQTKKALKDAVNNGKVVTYFQPGPFGGNEKQDGTIALEGPHYPEPHRWYAQAVVAGGIVQSVK